MKRASASFVLILMIWGCVSSATGQWVKSTQTSMSDIRCIVASGPYLFAGAYAGVYRSNDNGGTWVSVNSNTDVRELAVTARGLFAGSFGYGVMLTTDFGTHWTEVDSGLVNHNINCLLAGNGSLFAGSNGSVQRSADDGQYWMPSNASLIGTDVLALGLLGTEIFAGSNTTVSLSTDNAASWSPAGSDFNGSIGDFEALGNDLFAATVTGVFRTTNNGQNWAPADSGLGALQTTALAVDGQNVFVGTFGGGVFLSTNKGGYWSAVNTGLTYYTIYCLYINGGYLYAGTGGSVGSVWRRPLSEMVTSVGSAPDNVPVTFGLAQNYPNPFNPSTTIRFALPERSRVTLTVFNALGQQVATLVNGTEDAGHHEVKFDGSGMASGVYFYRLQAGDFAQTKMLILMK